VKSTIANECSFDGSVAFKYHQQETNAKGRTRADGGINARMYTIVVTAIDNN
jgi:hypothetical protein